MGMDVVLVHMSANDKSMVALRQRHGQIVANLVGLLRCDLPRLLCLVHFGVSGPFCVFGGAGGVDNGGVNDRAALHHMPGLLHDTFDCVKKQLVQAMFLQKMAKLAQSGFIRNGLRHEVNANEFTHGIAVIDGVLRGRIRQVEPDLKQVHPQHFFQCPWEDGHASLLGSAAQ